MLMMVNLHSRSKHDGRGLLVAGRQSECTNESWELDPEQTRIFGFGQPVPMGEGAGQGRCAVWGVDGRLMALGEISGDGLLRVLRGLNLPAA